MKKTLALLLALVMCFGLLAGCAKDEPQTENPGTTNPGTTDPGTTNPGTTNPGTTEPAKPAEPKIIKLLRSTEDTVVNPHDANNTANSALVDYMVSTLYSSRPSDDGSKALILPDFADGEPTLAEDKVTWTVKLRQDAVWPDGQKITADDWIYSWQKSMDPKLMYGTGSSAAKGANATIKGATEYYQQVANKVELSWDTVGIKKIDDYTLTIEVAQQVTQLEFMRHFTSRSLGLVRKDIYEKCISADGMTCDYGSSMDKVMFCGPYILKNWVKGSECEMVKNPTYVHADKVLVDGVYTRVVGDESTRLELFESGECDYVSLGTNGFAKYGEDPRIRDYTAKTIHTLEVNQNNPDKPYLADPTFRKALFYGIDRNAIAKLTNMLAAPYFISTVGQILDDGTTYRDYKPAADLLNKYAPNGGFDKELANKYLDETLKKYNLSSITLTITYNEDELRRQASEYIQSTFANVFDGKVKIELAATSKSALLALMRTSVAGPVNTWDLAWSGWGLAAESYAPWRKAKAYISTGGSRYTTYRNFELDKLCEMAETDEYRLDDEKLAQLTVDMEETMYEDMTCIPVVQGLSFVMFSERMEPAMKVYVSSVGWGTMWSGIK